MILLEQCLTVGRLSLTPARPLVLPICGCLAIGLKNIDAKFFTWIVELYIWDLEFHS